VNRKALSLLVLPALTWAQPPVRPEVYGHAGFLRAGGDEGALGTGPAFGGALMVPFRPKLALDVDVTSAKTIDEPVGGQRYRLRRTLLSPAVVWRTGSIRGYFFAGGGFGGQFDSGAGESKTTLLFKAGGAGVIRGRLLWRAGLLWSHAYVLPNISLIGSVGYRL